MRIQSLNLKHLRGAVRLEQACFPPPVCWSLGDYVDACADEGLRGLVALDPLGEVIGASWFADLEIFSIAVDPSHRGKGLAGRLLDDTLKQLNGRAKLQVACENEAAIGLYRGRGFRIRARMVGYYETGHAYLMTRGLR